MSGILWVPYLYETDCVVLIFPRTRRHFILLNDITPYKMSRGLAKTVNPFNILFESLLIQILAFLVAEHSCVFKMAFIFFPLLY
jgi:hypothetical protein